MLTAMKTTSNAVSATPILVIGIGNLFRGDDAAGLLVARQLRESCDSICTIVEHNGDGTGLMETWKDAESVVVIDAVRSGAQPGTIHRFEPIVRPLPALAFRYSTHAFSLVEAIDLSKALHHLPKRLIIYGIEGLDYLAGTNLSPEVAAAIPNAVEQVLQEVCYLHSRNGNSI